MARANDPDLDPQAILYGDLMPIAERPARARAQGSAVPGSGSPMADCRSLRGRKGRLYSWTLVPDQQGWFYSGIKLPRGPGARSGNPKRWSVSRRTIKRHRSLGQAKRRAVILKEEAED
jgi:hypothetical protein